MKKAFLVLLSMLIIASTPGLARASDDIRIFVNGIQIFSDIPPQLIGGRTMVPLRAISEALGAEVNWNASNRSVEITNNLTDNSEGNSNKVINKEAIDDNPASSELNNIELLKLYTKIARHYYNLGELHDQLIDVDRKIYYARKYGTETFIENFLADEIDNKLKNASENYNSLFKINQQFIDEAKKAGINIKDTEEILLTYHKILNSCKSEAFLLKSTSKPSYYIGSYKNVNREIAIQKSRDGYNKFNDLIQKLLADLNNEK